MDLNTIFKAYDVRGLYPSQIDEALAGKIGYAFAVFAGVERIAVGRDCRLSSPGIAAALMDGITRAGVDVADLGEITTDALYYVSGSMELPGVVVTASHNPPRVQRPEVLSRRRSAGWRGDRPPRGQGTRYRSSARGAGSSDRLLQPISCRGTSIISSASSIPTPSPR